MPFSCFRRKIVGARLMRRRAQGKRDQESKESETSLSGGRLGHDDLQRAFGGMSRQIHRGGGFLERELVGNQAPHIHTTGKDQTSNVTLYQEIRGITAEQIFFIDADRGQVEFGCVSAPGIRKQQQLSASAQQLPGLK